MEIRNLLDDDWEQVRSIYEKGIVRGMPLSRQAPLHGRNGIHHILIAVGLSQK